MAEVPAPHQWGYPAPPGAWTPPPGWDAYDRQAGSVPFHQMQAARQAMLSRGPVLEPGYGDLPPMPQRQPMLLPAGGGREQMERVMAQSRMVGADPEILGMVAPIPGAAMLGTAARAGRLERAGAAAGRALGQAGEAAYGAGRGALQFARRHPYMAYELAGTPLGYALGQPMTLTGFAGEQIGAALQGPPAPPTPYDVPMAPQEPQDYQFPEGTYFLGLQDLPTDSPEVMQAVNLGVQFFRLPDGRGGYILPDGQIFLGGN